MAKRYIPLILIFAFAAGGTGYFYWKQFPEEVMCGRGSSSSGAVKLNWVQPDTGEKILITEDKSRCAADLKECRIQLPAQQWMSLDLTPRPVLVNKAIQFKVRVSDSKIIPEEIDLIGVNLNMGYLRPKFKKIDETTYIAEFDLPFCEENEMRWQAVVHYRTIEKPDKISGALFNFSSYKK